MVAAVARIGWLAIKTIGIDNEGCGYGSRLKQNNYDEGCGYFKLDCDHC